VRVQEILLLLLVSQADVVNHIVHVYTAEITPIAIPTDPRNQNNLDAPALGQFEPAH
jgi:hypothetical protein